MNSTDNRKSTRQAPLRWQGMLFALAANWMSVAAVEVVLGPRLGASTLLLLLLVGAALLAGAASALYIGPRGGTHAFIGGALSIPLLAILVLNQNWSLAVYAGASCAFGGLLTELLNRRRNR